MLRIALNCEFHIVILLQILFQASLERRVVEKKIATPLTAADEPKIALQSPDLRDKYLD